MKKLLILLLYALFLSGCECGLSQIPPQYLQIDSTCGAALPDYLPLIRVTDNCRVVSVTQSPSPGSWLTVPTTTVLIRATDNFSNKTDMMFTVTLIDIEGPEFFLKDSTLITDSREKINTIYNIADRMLAYEELWFDSVFDYDAVGIPDTLRPLQQYFNKILVTWTTPALAFTGEGGRWHTFINESDTLLIRPKTDDWIGLLR